ncbi:hypothetical protein BDZ97DRAFT_1844870 [Flammula alnicola]|nr:hypothetical protein BDZ97DRAFT_1844870 [Flammula alnicola]
MGCILKLFSPSLGHEDILSGSEFFAALRLVIHAENGKEVDRSLAFVQADPSTSNQGQLPSSAQRAGQESRSTPSTSQAPSPAKRNAELPPPMPSRRPYTESSIAASSKPSSAPDPTSHNPFSSSDSHPQPPLHPSQRSESSRSLASMAGSQHSSHNPFVRQPPKSEDGTNKLPPLPPRKPPPPIPSHPQVPLVPPPRHLTTRNRAERSMSPAKLANPPPAIGTASGQANVISATAAQAKLPHHVTSTLMKQSLQASKVAQSMKRAEEQLEKERVMQVLKSSSVVSGTNIHNQHQHQRRSISPAKPYASSASSGSEDRAPPLPRRRHHQQEPSPPMSASSLEQVALAAPPPFVSPSATRSYPRTDTNPDSYSISPFRSPVDPVPPNNDSPDHSPSRSHIELPNGPPPTHPDRKPYIQYQVPSSFNASSSQRDDNLESFEAIYGPMTSSTVLSTVSSPTPANPSSPTGRVFRSKSMHQASPPLPSLPPPVRRKRPESVQVLGSGEVVVGSLTRREEPSSPTSSSGLSRHTSLSNPSNHRRSSLSVSSMPHSNQTSASSSHDNNPLSNIQRTIATLQPKLDALQIQPRLDKARYKAEAGLSRRGFVRDPARANTWQEGEEKEGLMGESRSRKGAPLMRGRSHWVGSNGDIERDDEDSRIFDDPEVDEDEDWSRSRGMDSSPVRRGRQNGLADNRDVFYGEDPISGVEKDNLKWPAGEGWKPL